MLWILKDAADPGEELFRAPADGLTATVVRSEIGRSVEPAAAGRQQAAERECEGGLAGAVRPDDRRRAAATVVANVVVAVSVVADSVAVADAKAEVTVAEEAAVA